MSAIEDSTEKNKWIETRIDGKNDMIDHDISEKEAKDKIMDYRAEDEEKKTRVIAVVIF